MTLNELIKKLQGEQDKHGDDEIGYEPGRDCIDILIGNDPSAGSSITIPQPSW